MDEVRNVNFVDEGVSEKTENALSDSFGKGDEVGGTRLEKGVRLGVKAEVSKKTGVEVTVCCVVAEVIDNSVDSAGTEKRVEGGLTTDVLIDCCTARDEE